MSAPRLKITIPENHQISIKVPEDIPAGPAEVVFFPIPKAVEEREPPAPSTEEARHRLKTLAAQWAADPRLFRDLPQEEREARLRQVMGIGRGLFSSSEEFARRKQEEIELEERRFAR